jgi:uncharacterized protein YheU (UPF0270 family)
MGSTRRPDPNDADRSSPEFPDRAHAPPGERKEAGVELSPDQLSAEALRGLVEEFVSREGTDYGHVDRSLASKVGDVLRQLESGEARIVFDLETETASIVAVRDSGRRA